MEDQGSPIWLALVAIAALLGIVGVITRPFLFEPLAVLCIAICARQIPSSRYTMPVAFLIMVCFLAGAAIAASGSHPLY